MSTNANDKKGYYVGYSYCGWVPNFKGGGRWMYFSTEKEYEDYYKEAVIDSWKRKAS